MDKNASSKFTEDDYLLIFAENVNKCLKQQEIEQRNLSIDTNIPEGNISRILRGKTKNPRFITLDLLSKAIQMDLTDLFKR